MKTVDIIILILALGFSIVPGIIKAMKKKAKGIATSTTASDNTMDNANEQITEPEYIIYQDILNTVTAEEDFYDKVGSYKYLREYSYEPGSEISAPMSAFEEPEVLPEESVDSPLAVFPSKIVADKIDIENNKQSANLSIGEIINGFNLRTAVIYSELLKPKFEEA